MVLQPVGKSLTVTSLPTRDSVRLEWLLGPTQAVQLPESSWYSTVVFASAVKETEAQDEFDIQAGVEVNLGVAGSVLSTFLVPPAVEFFPTFLEIVVLVSSLGKHRSPSDSSGEIANGLPEEVMPGLNTLKVLGAATAGAAARTLIARLAPASRAIFVVEPFACINRTHLAFDPTSSTALCE
jgi:hypothetical protein